MIPFCPTDRRNGISISFLVRNVKGKFVKRLKKRRRLFRFFTSASGDGKENTKKFPNPPYAVHFSPDHKKKFTR